ncbi:MAG: toll/interleukin-1 receptor domain-containing protein [Desulfovibrio sp.]|jgi:hypothetical protein|nr:toll/interleukin-1 receptor domain-containing protein [Desulfovibrio sp.]
MLERKTSCEAIPCGLEEESFLFVSYAHQDAGVVFPLIEGIHADGYQLWYDKGINISSTWTDEIALAILRCKVFVVFLSKDAVASSYVRAEVEFALNQRIKVIPVYLDGMEILPPGLALGLNATQGITGVESTQAILDQIRAALVYNKISKSGEAGKASGGERKSGGRARRGKPFSLPAVLSAILVLAVCAGYLLLRDTRFGAAPAGFFVALAKQAFLPAEPVQVSLSGLTPQVVDAGAIIGISRAEAEHGDFLSSRFIREEDARSIRGENGRLVRLRAPLDPGRYELRGYADGDALTESTLVARIGFSVEGTAEGAFSLAIDKSRYAPGEEIVIMVRGVPRTMLDDGALVGIYRAGAPPDAFQTYVLIGERDRQFSLDAPFDEGRYEIRSYATSSVFAESTLAARAFFEVIPPSREEAGK